MPRLVALVVIVACLATSGALGAEVVDRIVLRVNDRIATSVEYEQALEARRRAIIASDLEGEERREALDEAGMVVYRDLYTELLLLARADQLGIEITDDELETAMAGLRERLGLEDDEAFEQALASEGMDRERFTRQLRRNLLVQKVMAQEVRSRIDVDRAELRGYYEEHLDDFRLPQRLELIDAVVTEAAAPTLEERRDIAAEIRTELMSGRATDEVLSDYEDAEGVEFVDLGWVEAGDLDPALEEAAWGLDPDEVTDPVEARDAIHVLRVTDREESETRPFEEVEEQILELERSRRLDEEYAAYLEEVEERVFVDARPPDEAAGFEGL